MSCRCKRLIANPVKPENASFYDKHRLLVPCGKCPACRKQRSSDWFVRGYYHYISKPHDLFMVSLDFDNEHIPLYHKKYGNMRELSFDSQEPGMPKPPRYFKRFIDNPNFSYDDPFFENSEKVFPCFDSEILKGFFNRLRHYVPHFTYMYVSDYGDFLKRPHYHVGFFFDKDSVSKEDLLQAVEKCWICGSHEDLSVLRSCGSPLGAIQYMTNYATKDISFDFAHRETSLPYRYRSRIQASKGFGDYALTSGDITFEKIRDEHKVYIDINGKGIPKPFSIPRYYEQKLCYDCHYDSDTRITKLVKNKRGRELDEIRHNADYIHYFDIFKLSYSSFGYDQEVMDVFHSVYPDSPYNGLYWSDIVRDVLSREDDFKSFLYYRPFLHSNVHLSRNLGFYKRLTFTRYFSPSHYFPYYISVDPKTGKRMFFDASDVDLFVQASFLFDLYNLFTDKRLNVYDCWQASEQRKLRMRNDLVNHPGKRMYLVRKNFNFSSLNPQKFIDYVSHYQT